MAERWDVLAGLINGNGLRLGAEIGVNRGRNMERVLERCPGFEWIAVDDWRVGYSGMEAGLRRTQRAAFDQVLARWPSRIRLMEMDSGRAAQEIADASLDLVFIDGDHSREGVLRDIDLWQPKVRPGGFLTGDDHYERWPGVIEAVAERFPEATIDEPSVWSVRL